MRGYFAIINDEPFDLGTISLTQASKIRGVEENHVSVAVSPQSKAIEVELVFADLTKETYTNAGLAEAFKELLRTKKITKIDQLSKVATVYIEYTVVDLSCNEVVDHGIGVKEVTPSSFLFPLGITDENEYVSRLGLEFPVRVTQTYRPKHPYGIMGARRSESYRIYINRVVVTQLLERAWSVTPSLGMGLSGKPTHGCGGHHGSYGRPPFRPNGIFPVIEYGPNAWGNPFWMSDLGKRPGVPSHPSCADVAISVGDSLVDKKDIVVVYDSAQQMENDYIYASAAIAFAPQTVTFNFTMRTILPILINKEDVEEVMKDVQKTIDEEKEAEKKDPETIDNPLSGDEKDPTNPSESPDIPEEGGENNPLVGDDDDIVTPGNETEGGGSGPDDSTPIEPPEVDNP